MIANENLMIGNGLVVGDLVTIDDCDDALTELDTTVGLLVSQIEEVEAQPDPPDPDWFRRLKLTLKLRRVARVAVQKKRVELRKAQQLEIAEAKNADLIGVFKNLYPAEFARALDVYNASVAEDRGG